jgi:hypothetical protein
VQLSAGTGRMLFLFTLPALNYRELQTAVRRGRDWRNRLSCQRRVDKVTNGPSPIN